MGILKKISDANYSGNAIGKYDFGFNIFRRKVGGQLERNYLQLNSSRVESYKAVSLSKNQYTVRASFVYNGSGQECNLFSVADYSTSRAFNVSHYRSGTTLLMKAILIIGTTVYQYSVQIGISVPTWTNEECEFTIDFATNTIKDIKINRGPAQNPIPTSSTNASAWANTKKRTICVGEIASYTENTGSLGFPYFAQLTDAENNDILLHYDYLGDNDVEVLTDKANMIQLSKVVNVINGYDYPVKVVSRPIEL